MSLVGFDLAFENSVERPIQTPGVAQLDTAEINIALPSAPAIAFLKMRAWLDRPAARAKDLKDLALLFERYVGEERRWSDELVHLGGIMDYEDVSPFVLGKDLARIADHEHRLHVEEFLSAVQPTALAYRASPFAEGDERAHAAFARGFQSTGET